MLSRLRRRRGHDVLASSPSVSSNDSLAGDPDPRLGPTRPSFPPAILEEPHAAVPLSESNQRWQMQHRFRSIIVWLLFASSTTAAVLMLGPKMISGCDDGALLGQDCILIVLVLVVLPGMIAYANHVLHKRGASSRDAKRAFAPLLLAFYLPIVVYDSQTHIAEKLHEGALSIHGAPSACETRVTNMPNHTSDTMMLTDVAFNFFVCACLLESWRTRALHIVCHTVIWSCDNFTYAQFSSPDISTAQRLWHWVGFISVDAQLMATVVAIAQAIDALWDAHLAQARLEVRVEQIENEKERLMWDTALREHRTIVGPPFSHWDDTQSSSQGGRPARSHHTAKLD